MFKPKSVSCCFCSWRRWARFLLSPVEVVDEPLLVAGGQLTEQPLVFAEQTQVVGHGEGLPAEAGDGLHALVAVQLEAEVVPRLCPSRHDATVLQRNVNKHPESQRGKLLWELTPDGSLRLSTSCCIDAPKASHRKSSDAAVCYTVASLIIIA